MRFASDRGDVYGDVARQAQPSEWYPLDHAIAAIRRSQVPEEDAGLRSYARGVRETWTQWAEAFGSRGPPPRATSNGSIATWPHVFARALLPSDQAEESLERDER